MKFRTLFPIVVAVFAVTATSVTAQLTPLSSPSAQEVLRRLRPEHPRLLFSSNDVVILKQRIATTPQLTNWQAKLRARAERMVQDAPSKYEIPDGLRLLTTSRRVLERVYTLALFYRLEGDRRWADRCWQELDAAAHFPDWNPRHFLDTAEMTHAFAIGYDWLYDAWTPEQRTALRAAIVEKGLAIAVDCYRGKTAYGWWTKATHNWNQVCNGGIGMGALALADEQPDLAGEFLTKAIASLQLPMREFAPDGAWNEGPGYWSYATSYNVVFLAALDSALGTDFGLARMPGFADTGLFPIYLTGPLGRTFNYADGSDGTIRAPQMFWLARKFERSVYAWYERDAAFSAPLDLVWFSPEGRGPKMDQLPLDKYFRGVEVATFRSGWEDRMALFVGFKGGDNKANHSNLDLGSFVLDGLGHRWAVDLGADNYNLPGYFGNQRWTYYRMRAEGHNTLVINPGTEPDQDPKAAARIVRYASRPDWAFAIADLTAAYGPNAREVKRGVGLVKRGQVLLQDEFQLTRDSEVWWFFHTPAEVDLSGENGTATLRIGNKRLQAQILSPDKARFMVMDAQPLPGTPHPEKQAPNTGIRKLAIHLTGVQNVRITVAFTPQTNGTPATAVRPLTEW